MTEVTQYCVGLQNTPGTLAGLCELLKRFDVNIEALFVTEDTEGCWVNMIATPADRVEEALADAGHTYFTENVLKLQTVNQPGVLGHISTRLHKAGVNINYVYGGGSEDSNFTLVMNVDDIELAKKAFED